MKLSKTLLTIATVGVFTVFTGCDSQGVGSDDSGRVTLSIMAVNSGSAAKSGSAVAQVTLAKVLLRTIQFHARDVDETTEGVDFQAPPMVAVLDPSSPASFELDVVAIPAGTYHKISFRIHKPEIGETFLDPPEFNIGDEAHERFSVIAEGTLDGDPEFMYRSEKAMQQQQVTFEGDLIIDTVPTDYNVTLLVDLSDWFKDSDGYDLDPTDMSANNTSMIDKSIRESFRIFKDNNRDGQPD